MFAHAPTEFKLTPCMLSWEDPCWVHADISLVPQTPVTREEFFASLLLPNRWDAFSKVSWENLLGDAFSPYFSEIKGPHADDWIHALLNCHQELKRHLPNTQSMFPEPFHFVARQEFATVDLPTILKENPENLSVYVAYEKGSYCHFYYLRIHSKPPFFGPRPKCLWFQIRLPDLHPEDVIPWFVATIRRLPKKHQPS